MRFWQDSGLKMAERDYFRLTHAYLDSDAVRPRPMRQRYLEILLNDLDPRDIVVELGCGNGTPVAEAVASRARFIGVDLVNSRLAEARRRVPSGLFLNADLTKLGFVRNSLAAVVSCYTPIHVPVAQLRTVLADIAGWLRPEGYFVGAIGTRCSVFHDAVPETVTCVPADQLASLLTNVGFEIFKSELSGFNAEAGFVEFLWIVARVPRRMVEARLDA